MNMKADFKVNTSLESIRLNDFLDILYEEHYNVSSSKYNSSES